jgi:ubiquinone/menaquinone biosynthesis C-methylase UbiE
MMMNVKAVSDAFTKQSQVFDSLEEQNKILQWMRGEIHNQCLEYFKPGDKILELNCGTGIDAVFFAEHGMHVHATDLSEGMLDQLKRKVSLNKLSEKISIQQCSFADLTPVINLAGEKKFDHIFSDFGGLNCVQDIETVIWQFKKLLNPGSTVTLVIMPPVCPWEMLFSFKGNFKTAFRRLKKNGADANVEGIHFTTYYYSPSRIIKAFGKDYSKVSMKGLSCFAPPPYLEKFPEKYPSLFKFLTRLDKKFGSYFPFNRWGDHFILTMKLI